MNNKLLSGKLVSKNIYKKLKNKINTIKEKDIVPRIEVILIGDRSESKLYVRMKQKKCKELGIICNINKFDIDTTNEIILNMINSFNLEKKIHGILVQLPLPEHLNKNLILNTISNFKDVDGFNNINMGKLAKNNNPLFISCTAEGCYKLLEYYNINVSGKLIVIIGCSITVGLPVSLLLLNKDATPIICHSLTKNLNILTKQADIIITCCGQCEMVKKEWIKKDCVIIDVGINKKLDITKKKGYRLVGDVDFIDVKNKVSYISPVPGGVGPMTICILIKNIIKSAYINNDLSWEYI